MTSHFFWTFFDPPYSPSSPFIFHNPITVVRKSLTASHLRPWHSLWMIPNYVFTYFTKDLIIDFRKQNQRKKLLFTWKKIRRTNNAIAQWFPSWGTRTLGVRKKSKRTRLFLKHYNVFNEKAINNSLRIYANFSLKSLGIREQKRVRNRCSS